MGELVVDTLAAVIEGSTAWDWAIILVALSAPTVILVLVAMLRGYNIKFWRGSYEPSDKDHHKHQEDQT
ncbi:MAG: hypothetical protein ACOYB3_01785 [Azonexus sp.]